MLTDLRGAIAFLTIVPVGSPSDESPGRTFAYYPIIGLMIGAILAAIASIEFLSLDVVAFLTLAAWVTMTGGLHLDGFADSSDGLLATVEPARRLEIMKDPRSGSWAVVGLVLLLLGKWVTLRGIDPILLLLPPVLGRWTMVLAVARFPYARETGLGAYFRKGFGATQVLVATVLAATISAAFGWPVVMVIVIAPVMVLTIGRWASGRLGGGLTGDVYGALCELTELVCLLVLQVT